MPLTDVATLRLQSLLIAAAAMAVQHVTRKQGC